MELMRKSEIKRKYNISYTTLRVWEKQGLISGINGVLFDKEQIEKVMKRERQKTKMPEHWNIEK